MLTQRVVLDFERDENKDGVLKTIFFWQKGIVFPYLDLLPNPSPEKQKESEKNHVSLCASRDPMHIHIVINRFRAIASPPRGHRRQAQRSCPLWEEPPEGIFLIF